MLQRNGKLTDKEKFLPDLSLSEEAQVLPDLQSSVQIPVARLTSVLGTGTIVLEVVSLLQIAKEM